MPWEEWVRILFTVAKEVGVSVELEAGIGTDGKTVANVKARCNVHVEGK